MLPSTNGPRPTMSSTNRTVTRAQRQNPVVTVLPRSSPAFSGDAAASVGPNTPAPTQTVHAGQPPVLIGQNSTPSGDTAGAGLIHQIRTNINADGSLTVELRGVLGPGLVRATAPNYNRTVPSGTEIGLHDYEVAHAWGPGFGDEARDGMMYAPKAVNQDYQNKDIESRLRELRMLAAREGGTIRLTVRTESHPLNTWHGHHLLKQASYHFEVDLPGGQSVTIGQVDIHVPPPTASGRASGKPTVEVTGGSQAIWSLK